MSPNPGAVAAGQADAMDQRYQLAPGLEWLSVVSEGLSSMSFMRAGSAACDALSVVCRRCRPRQTTSRPWRGLTCA